MSEFQPFSLTGVLSLPVTFLDGKICFPGNRGMQGMHKEGGGSMANQNMDRRAFMRGAAATGLAVGLAGMVGCTKPGGDKASAVFTPGTYTAEVVGHNAPFKMQATFTNHALTDINVSESMESPGVGVYAMEKLSREIIKNQSMEVDAISGATLSSSMLLQGLKDCIKQAGGTSLEGSAPAAESLDSEYEADVCIIGGGGAGCVAAIRAAQAKARVVILEKCGITGGSTNVSDGALNAVDPYRQGKQGIEDSIDKFYTTTLEGGHNIGDPALVHYLTDHAMESVEWLEELGVAFKMKIGSATGSLGERSHYTVAPLGSGYTNAFRSYIAKNPDSIRILNDTPASEIVTDSDGSVIGVKGTRADGSEVMVKARSVVVTTGGFGANVEYRQAVNTGVWSEVVLDKSIGCSNIKPCAQGDGLKLAEAAGAQLIGLSDIQLHPCGSPGSGLMEEIGTNGRNRIFVNESGDRFVEEGAARDTLCKAIFKQPNSTYWIVVNKVRYPEPSKRGSSGKSMEDLLTLGKVVSGETLDELATTTGMDATKLKASIETYNAVVAGEQQDPFGFKANNSSDVQLTEGPWYASKKVPTVHHTMGGIRVNEKSEVLNSSGSVIKNLYAAGECTGGVHGSNRLGGNAIADVMTLGRNAGLSAATNALTKK